MHAAGQLSGQALREAEDRAILDALELQRAVGIDVFTDGEYRPASWLSDLADAVDGFDSGGFLLQQRGASGQVQGSGQIAVVAPLRQRRRLTEHEVPFLKAHAPGPFKVTIPSPTNFAYLSFQPGLSDRSEARDADTQGAARRPKGRGLGHGDRVYGRTRSRRVALPGSP